MVTVALKTELICQGKQKRVKKKKRVRDLLIFQFLDQVPLISIRLPFGEHHMKSNFLI